MLSLRIVLKDVDEEKWKNKLKFIFLRQEHHHVRRIGLNIKFTIFPLIFFYYFVLSHFMHSTMGKVQIHIPKECYFIILLLFLLCRLTLPSKTIHCLMRKILHKVFCFLHILWGWRFLSFSLTLGWCLAPKFNTQVSWRKFLKNHYKLYTIQETLPPCTYKSFPITD